MNPKRNKSYQDKNETSLSFRSVNISNKRGGSSELWTLTILVEDTKRQLLSQRL